LFYIHTPPKQAVWTAGLYTGGSFEQNYQADTKT
jgi:hypothetical protein